MLASLKEDLPDEEVVDQRDGEQLPCEGPREDATGTLTTGSTHSEISNTTQLLPATYSKNSDFCCAKKESGSWFLE